MGGLVGVAKGVGTAVGAGLSAGGGVANGVRVGVATGGRAGVFTGAGFVGGGGCARGEMDPGLLPGNLVGVTIVEERGEIDSGEEACWGGMGSERLVEGGRLDGTGGGGCVRIGGG